MEPLRSRMSELRQRIFVAFDTETTGLDPRNGNVVEIAGVRFTATGQEISRFSTLANPGRPIGREVTEIHGIDDTMVARAPNSSIACMQFARWLHPEDVLVAHNAAFDVAFIATELTRAEEESPRNVVLDTWKLAKVLEVPVHSFRLQSLLEHFGIVKQAFHRAMADALNVKALFLEFLEQLPNRQLQELEADAGVESHHQRAPSTLPLLPRFATLHEAIDRGHVLRMTYEDDGSFRPQRVLPLTVSVRDGREVLVVQCMADGSVRQFELDRVVSIEEPSSADARMLRR